MKLQLLPSTFDNNGCASPRQHLTSFIVDDRVAVDAGSLGFAVNDLQRRQVRDVVLTHAHLDHIAGLPLFIDDLFSELDEPVRVHAAAEVIEVLERDVFNWSVYPRFSELSNVHGPVMEYRTLKTGEAARVAHLEITPLEVNHRVPSTGFVISDDSTTIALTGDTAELAEFWEQVNAIGDLKALLVECAFPDELEELAAFFVSHDAGTIRARACKIQKRRLPGLCHKPQTTVPRAHDRTARGSFYRAITDIQGRFDLRILDLLDGISEEVEGFERSFAVLVGKIVKLDAAIGSHSLNAEGAFLAGTAGHDLGLECDLHLGTGPYARGSRCGILSFLISLKHSR